MGDRLESIAKGRHTGLNVGLIRYRHMDIEAVAIKLNDRLIRQIRDAVVEVTSLSKLSEDNKLRFLGQKGNLGHLTANTLPNEIVKPGRVAKFQDERVIDRCRRFLEAAVTADQFYPAPLHPSF